MRVSLDQDNAKCIQDITHDLFCPNCMKKQPIHDPCDLYSVVAYHDRKQNKKFKVAYGNFWLFFSLSLSAPCRPNDIYMLECNHRKDIHL